MFHLLSAFPTGIIRKKNALFLPWWKVLDRLFDIWKLIYWVFYQDNMIFFYSENIQLFLV